MKAKGGRGVFVKTSLVTKIARAMLFHIGADLPPAITQARNKIIEIY